MLKKKKENLSEEFLRNKDPLAYCILKYKKGTVFNNSKVVRFPTGDFKITEYYEIKGIYEIIDEYKVLHKVHLDIFYDKLMKNHNQGWTLWSKDTGEFAKIIK